MREDTSTVGAGASSFRRESRGDRITVSVKVVPPPRRGVTTMSPPIERASCFTDDKPEPGAAEPQRDADIGLRERAEQTLDLGECETDAAVGYRKR